MKRFVVALCLTLGLFVIVKANTINLNQKLPLSKATHINYDVSSWDTIFVIIRDSADAIMDTVFLTTRSGKGRWKGSYTPTKSGGFVAEYNAVYSGDTTVEEQYFSVLDTAAFHGAAAGLTAEEIADTLGGRGYFSGIGIFACSVYTKLSSDSSAIPSIHVIAKNTNQDATLAHGYTDANGMVILALDSITGSGYHKFWLIDPEYSFTFPESADVNTDTGVIFYGSMFDYGDPPTANQCAVYDQLFNLELDSLSGVVITAEIRLPADSILRYDGYIISPFKVSDTTTVTGRWRLDLPPNSDFLPADTWYIFTFKYRDTWGGWIVRKDSTQVPDSTSIRYKTMKGW